MKKTFLILIAIAMLMVSCTVKPTEEKKHEHPNKCVVTELEVVGTNFTRTVEKFTIEGHEYLVFTSKVANPPTVIHSESCSCHSKPVEVKLK